MKAAIKLSKLDFQLYPNCAKYGIKGLPGAPVVPFSEFGAFIEKHPKLIETSDYWIRSIGAHHRTDGLRAGDVEQFLRGTAKGVLA